jgi:16S rRNA U516 pseudouridylate synthase RsuA-like enzyme
MLMTNHSKLASVMKDPTDDIVLCDSPYKAKIYRVRFLGKRLYDLLSDPIKKHELEIELSQPFQFQRNSIQYHTLPATNITIISHFQDINFSNNQSFLGWCIDVDITLHEGKHHQIRRIGRRSNLHILSLQRICIGKILHIDSVPLPGDCRRLEQWEIDELLRGLQIDNTTGSST